jgi:pimeloyl-ACP methyl ester carboxylesterase
VVLGQFVCVACVGSVSTATASPSTAPQPPSAYCLTPEQVPRAVQFAGLHGQIVGSGPVAVVLTNGSGDDPCVWANLLPSLLSSQAYRVLLYFFRLEHENVERDIAAADEFMSKQKGVTRVILIGHSLGGEDTLAIASSIQPAPAAVVSFSGPSSPDEVRNLQIPTLIVTSENDRFLPGKAAREVFAAIPATDKELYVYPGQLHGVDILLGPNKTEALKVFGDFLSRHSS